MKATVLLPTTADRGPLLQYSAGSVLRQSIEDIELFIVGDGVAADTREAARTLARQDPRVRFFDFPKDQRRGEPNRDQVLRHEAAGDIVCYVCDRDMLLSNHVAEARDALRSCDIMSTLCYQIHSRGAHRLAYLDPDTGQRAAPRLRRLSCVAHTLDAYKALPHGWRTTPVELFTDIYMWDQFLEQPGIRARIVSIPTVLYFKRGSHPGWPTPDRRRELEQWYTRLTGEGGEARIHQEMMYAIVQSLSDRLHAATRSRPATSGQRVYRALRRLAGRGWRVLAAATRRA